GPVPSLFLADMSRQAEVRKLAGEVRAALDRLDVLVNNVGTLFGKRELTIDGIERTLAINHLAPFLLTDLLLPLVLAAPAGRIVNVSAEAYSKKLDFDNLQTERKHSFFPAYTATKLCNVLFTNELARRLDGT